MHRAADARETTGQSNGFACIDPPTIVMHAERRDGPTVSRPSSGVVALLVVLALLWVPTGCDTTSTCDCAAPVWPFVSFVGEVVTIEDDLVTFSVTDVRSGLVDDTTAAVRYLEGSARELRVGRSYLVGAYDRPDGLTSVVPGIGDCTCGGETRNEGGSAIDVTDGWSISWFVWLIPAALAALLLPFVGLWLVVRAARAIRGRR